MSELQTGTPRNSGYRMPAEWEPRAGTWIAWPHNASDWPGKFASIPWLYAEIVRLLAQRETVHEFLARAAHPVPDRHCCDQNNLESHSNDRGSGRRFRISSNSKAQQARDSRYG